MSWSYSAGVLTTTGASEGSPDSLLSGIAVVQAADATRGYVNGLVGWLNNVEIRVEIGSFFAFDAYAQISLRGSSFVNVQGAGGVIHDYVSTVVIETSTQTNDAACDFPTGSTLICRRLRLNDPSPRIIYRNTARHDYPNVQNGSVPAKIQIAGLDMYDAGGTGGASFKVFFGLATVASVANVRLFVPSNASPYSFQLHQTTYDDLYYEKLTVHGNGPLSVVNLNRPTFRLTTAGPIEGVQRGLQMTWTNPSFLGGGWNEAVLLSGGDLLSDSFLRLGYTYQPTFRSGQTALQDVRVRYSRATAARNNSPSWALPGDATLVATSDAAGTHAATFLLDAYRQGTQFTALDRFSWGMKARRYDRRTAAETVFSGRVLFKNAVLMSAGYAEEVQMLAVPHLTLSEAQAAALTGLALVANGTTGGTITVSANRTTAEVWHFYRQWIAQTANFDSEDTWTFDGSTLNIGAWSVVVAFGAALTGSLTASGTVSGRVDGVVRNATVIRATPGIWSPSLDSATIRFTTAGSYDLRGATLAGTITLTNTSGGAVTVFPPAGASIINTGPGITLDTSQVLTIESADGLALSTLVMVNGSIVDGLEDGWVVGEFTRTVNVQPEDEVRIYAHTYGYQPKVITGTGAFPAAAAISLLPELVNITLPRGRRDTLASHFSSGVDAQSRVWLAVDTDMSGYTPEEVLNALHYFLVRNGYHAAAGALVAGTTDAFGLIDGGFVLRSPGFYGKISDTVTVLPDSGIYVPLFVEVDPSVVLADPSFMPFRKNSSGLLLGHALWTKAQANITAQDHAKAATAVWSAPARTLNGALFT